MNNIEKIEQSPVYQQILKDSFGGIMYNVSNRDKYDATEIIKLWEGLTEGWQESAGGIMQGVFNFLMNN